MDGYHLLGKNAPAPAPPAKAKGPYNRLPDDPTLNLETVIEGEPLPGRQVQWGPYTLDRPQHNALRTAAYNIEFRGSDAAKRDLVNILAQVKAGGKIPLGEPVNRAPQGTTVNDLLDLKDQKPNKNGMYELGNLRVPAKEYPEFAAAQREMCAKNPEALDLLYYMENHNTGRPLTVQRRPTAELSSGAAYSSTDNAIYWSPVLGVRDKVTFKVTPPGTGLLHEETHWAAGEIGELLKMIPDKKFDNVEEKRVITGAEARDLEARHLKPRESHTGHSMRVLDVNSVQPEIVIDKGQGVENRHAGFQQTGKIVAYNDKSVTMQTLAHNSESTMTFRMNDMLMATGLGRERVTSMIKDAKDLGETVTMHVTHDGVYYENRAQIDRWKKDPNSLEAKMAAAQERDLGRAGIHPHEHSRSVGLNK